MQDFDIGGREMRILDPLIPIQYPIDIMVREKAILLNLEAIRMVIQKDNVSCNTTTLLACPTLDVS